MVNVLSTILPVIIMLSIGCICRHFSLFTRDGIDALKKFVVNIALSAVLINAFATMEYSLANLLLALIMFALCIIAWFIGRLFIKVDAKSGKFIPFLVTGFEAGMLGYAFFTMLYGADYISEFAKLDLGQVLFVFTFYKIMLGIDGNEKIGAKRIAKEMFTSPTIISIIVGVIIGITGLHNNAAISSVIDACTNFVSAPTSAVILFSIGYDLVFDKIPWLATCKAVACRFIIMIPARIILGIILNAMGMSHDTINALNVMLILPPPFVISVFADDNEQQTFISSTLTVSTIITIIGFMILAILMEI